MILHLNYKRIKDALITVNGMLDSLKENIYFLDKDEMQQYHDLQVMRSILMDIKECYDCGKICSVEVYKNE